MAYMLSHFKVADYATWVRAFEEGASIRRANGSHGGWVFQNPNDPHEVFGIIEVENADVMRRFLESPEVQERMRQAGVTQPEIYSNPIHVDA